MNGPLTRRQLLGLMGAAGGATAVYRTSLALGLLPEAGPAPEFDLLDVADAPKKIAVLGAGIAGLTVAYELERAGYDCTIIEASRRIGGRVLTLRHGDVVDEMGYEQVCDFDDEPHLYFNAGAARIPGHHQRTLHYCKLLGVGLEVMANDNRLAFTQDDAAFGGKPQRIRRYTSDARGFLAELLYKAVNRNAFDEPLSAADRERLVEFVRAYGDLQPDGRYAGSDRAGYASGGFLEHGELHEPLEFAEILKSGFWRRSMHAHEAEFWPPPLMTPTGGMDNIVKAFVREIASPIVTDAQVQAIHHTPHGVDVVYNHGGRRHKLAADYCFNSIPSQFIAAIPNNLSKEYVQALNAMERGTMFKMGLQMKERFWEREQIYGGISYTSQEISEIWYPSHGIHKQKGVVLGAYTFGAQRSAPFERMTPDERIRFGARQGDAIHEGYSDYVENGVSVPWSRMKFMMGCGNEFAEDDVDRYFKTVQNPDARHYMIGDQISYHSSWQEGAFASAIHAVEDLDRRVRAERSGGS